MSVNPFPLGLMLIALCEEKGGHSRWVWTRGRIGHPGLVASPSRSAGSQQASFHTHIRVRSLASLNSLESSMSLYKNAFGMWAQGEYANSKKDTEVFELKQWGRHSTHETPHPTYSNVPEYLTTEIAKKNKKKLDVIMMSEDWLNLLSSQSDGSDVITLPLIAPEAAIFAVFSLWGLYAVLFELRMHWFCLTLASMKQRGCTPLQTVRPQW